MFRAGKVLLWTGLMMLVFSTAAEASSFTFTYSVTGNANAAVAFPILSYNFVPTSIPVTIFGPLDVRYQGNIDLLAGQGPTTTVWDFGASGKLFGTGLEFVDPPDSGGVSPFHGTSIITGGTGPFAGAIGNTSYVGSFNGGTGIASFTETINVTTAPEPTSVSLLSAALAVMVVGKFAKRYWA